MKITGKFVVQINQEVQIWDDEGLYGVEIDSNGKPVGVFPLNSVNRDWIEPHLPPGINFPD